MKTVKIKVKNLMLRTIIGINDWEREKKQDVVINASLEFDKSDLVKSDAIEDTVNYKSTVKSIIEEVEKSQFNLLEKLADHILSIIMQDRRVVSATVEVDKPHSVRFSESISATVSAKR